MRGGGILGVIVLIWLLVGVYAAWDRGYFSDQPETCGVAATIALNIIAGPLNFFAVDPHVGDCRLPEPV
jgi:hypothetical protein